MSNNLLLDKLETDFGRAILEKLVGGQLEKSGQPVRLFDRTRRSAEVYYPADKRGKPLIYNHQTGDCWYPVTAYSKTQKLDFNTAFTRLYREYYGVDLTDKPMVKKKSVSSGTTPSLPKFTPSAPLTIDYLPESLYQKSQTQFDKNGLYEYMRYRFSTGEATDVFDRYRLGTSRRWRHLGYLATCLPQFDRVGNLRQVKIMPFDAMNGRRVKQDEAAEIWDHNCQAYKPTTLNDNKVYFAGNQIAILAGMTNAELVQCLFGEHLLPLYPDKKVALVEGESTALFCSIDYPEYIWLATGGSTGAGWTKPETFSVFSGRHVVLWPDSGKLEEWRQKAEALRPLVASLDVTDYVEKHAPDGKTNIDLRDLMTRPYYRPADGSPPIFGEAF